MANRNAAQLRADATATGYFNGPKLAYVGDGYSIPYEAWYVPSTGFRGQLYVFKQYLDTFHLEYSRLHDWLYTPYGALISATQEEADLALGEELSAVDPVSGPVVYRACAAFGHLYFGVSMVGYQGTPPDQSGGNMGVADSDVLTNFGGTGVAIKAVILFQQTTAATTAAPSLGYVTIPRTAGWSESIYGPDNPGDITALLKGPRSPLKPLLEARAALLGSAGRIIGVRLYQGGAGKGQLLNATYAGTASTGSDMPSVALLLSATNKLSGLSRRWMIRGIPDANVEEGEFSPGPAIIPRLQTYFAALAGFGWMGSVSTNQKEVVSITAGGVVTTKTAHGFAQFASPLFKQIFITATGKRVGGTFKISTLNPDPTVFTIQDWTNGAGTGGTVGFDTLAFQQFINSDISIVRATARKVGRPFAGFRGRASTRKSV